MVRYHHALQNNRRWSFDCIGNYLYLSDNNMHKVLVVELYPAKGHKKTFVSYSTMLKKNFDTTIVVPKNFKSNILNEELIYTPFNYYEDLGCADTAFNRIKYSVKVTRFVNNLCKKLSIDTIICVTYDELAYLLTSKFFLKKKNVFLFQHNNIDNCIESKYRGLALRRFANKVSHIVLGSFIKKALVEKFNVDTNKVIALPHPLNEINSEKCAIFDCVGLSNGNDEKIINAIIESERQNATLMNQGKHVVLKSKNQSFDNEYLRVLNGFIPDEQYDKYINSARYLYMPFPLFYKYRMSGTLVDALGNGKQIIASDIELVRQVASVYPNIVRIMSGYNLTDYLIKGDITCEQQKEFDKFSKYHSLSNVERILCESINKILNNESLTDQCDF